MSDEWFKSALKKNTERLHKRFVNMRVRMRRKNYPVFRRRFVRRRRRFIKRRRFGFRRRRTPMLKTVRRLFNKPILVKFSFAAEHAIASDNYSEKFVISLADFNADQIRQQLYGYVELFDQFRMVCQHATIHFKTSAEWTDLNTNIPELYWAYDHDMNNRSIDIFNLMKMQNHRHMLMPPLKKLKLRLRPRWTDNRLVVKQDGKKVYLDTQSGISRVDNPWMDTEILSMNAGAAPIVRCVNGYCVGFKNCNKRAIVVHTDMFVQFRGRKNNQSYIAPPSQ